MAENETTRDDDYYVMSVDTATGELSFRRPRPDDAFCPRCRHDVSDLLDARLAAPDHRADNELRGRVETLALKWSGCWCETQMAYDHDPRVRDCPQHGSDDCQHMAKGITLDLRALLDDAHTDASEGATKEHTDG